jgi:hypothetical protein
LRSPFSKSGTGNEQQGQEQSGLHPGQAYEGTLLEFFSSQHNFKVTMYQVFAECALYKLHQPWAPLLRLGLSGATGPTAQIAPALITA